MTKDETNLRTNLMIVSMEFFPGNYLFVEASGPSREGDFAQLASPELGRFQLVGGACASTTTCGALAVDI